jgi:hypothetical protein
MLLLVVLPAAVIAVAGVATLAVLVAVLCPVRALVVFTGLLALVALSRSPSPSPSSSSLPSSHPVPSSPSMLRRSSCSMKSTTLRDTFPSLQTTRKHAKSDGCCSVVHVSSSVIKLLTSSDGV